MKANNKSGHARFFHNYNHTNPRCRRVDNFYNFLKILADPGGVSHFLAEPGGGVSHPERKKSPSRTAPKAPFWDFGAAGAVLENFLRFFEKFLNKNAIKSHF